MKKSNIIILTLCGLFLFYKYIAQLFPTLIGSELMQDYKYSAMMLALITSSYYWSYTLMQIFAGFIIDRYNTGIIMFLAIFIISLMILLFSYTDNFYIMCLSRIFMGIGTAFATLLYIKCAAQYTSPKLFGLVSSFLATATMLGAAFGGAPIAYVFHHIGWHQGLTILSAVGFTMAFATIYFHTFTQTPRPSISAQSGFSIFKVMISRKDNWLLLLYSGLTFSPVAILGGLWGTPFLMTKLSITAESSAIFLSIMFIGLAVGAPIWALLSAKLKCRESCMYFSSLLSFIATSAIIYGHLSYLNTLFVFFILGFSVGCFMHSFEICRETNPTHMMGMAVAFINTGEGLICALVEPLIGHILDTLRIETHLTLSNYQAALSLLPVCYMLSFIPLYFLNKHKAELQLGELVGA